MPLKGLPATSAFGRHAGYHVLALVGGNQCPFVFVVAGLTAAPAFGFGFSGWRFSVRVRGGRGRGGVGRVFAAASEYGDFRFQFRHAHRQSVNLPRLPLDQCKDFRWQRTKTSGDTTGGASMLPQNIAESGV